MQDFESFDLPFWMKRAVARDGAQMAVYSRKKDSLIPLEFSYKESTDLLPVTKKGKAKALFLDRDGIINIDQKYVHKTEDVSFVEGIVDVIRWANDNDYKVIVLTNQSGVGRGFYSEEDVLKLHEWMGNELEKMGATVDGWYYSPYHPESEEPKYKRVSYTRKPKPGMALMAAEDWEIDLSRSMMIGDKVSDVLNDVDLPTFLLQGNYPLGDYPYVFENLFDLLEHLNKECP